MTASSHALYLEKCTSDLFASRGVERAGFIAQLTPKRECDVTRPHACGALIRSNTILMVQH